MRNQFAKIQAVILAATLVFTALPGAVFAADGTGNGQKAESGDTQETTAEAELFEEDSSPGGISLPEISMKEIDGEESPELSAEDAVHKSEEENEAKEDSSEESLKGKTSPEEKISSEEDGPLKEDTPSEPDIPLEEDIPSEPDIISEEDSSEGSFSEKTPAEEEVSGSSQEETPAWENDAELTDVIIPVEGPAVETDSGVPAEETVENLTEDSSGEQADTVTEQPIEEKTAPEMPSWSGEAATAPGEGDASGSGISNGTVRSAEIDEIMKSGEIVESSSDLFEEYARKVFGLDAQQSNTGNKKRSRKAMGSALEGSNRVIYDALHDAAALIAAGERASGIVEIPLSAFGIDADKQYTAQDLGLDYIYKEENGEDIWNDATGSAMQQLIGFEWDPVESSLRADYPYEFYWLYGGITYPLQAAVSMGAEYNSSTGWNGYATFSSSSLTFKMPVDPQYRLDAGDAYTADTAKTGAASAAASFAQSIVNEAAGLSDYEKLVYYKDRICGLNVYNEDARQKSSSYPNGGPWALIYVFDQDDSTNVVCEGYSEAFQYLCDLTQFTNGSICAYCVTGTMTGGTGAGLHKWNIIHMDDGLNYMADVTNSDEGSIGQDGRLFLKGITGTVEEGYTLSWEERQEEVEEEDGTYIYTWPAGSISYIYDDETRALFSIMDLTLSAQDYAPGTVPPLPTVDEIASIDALSLFLTDKIGLRVHVTPLLEEYLTEDDYMTFTCAGHTVKQSVAEAKRDENYRLVFSLDLAARQMADEVTFFMTVNGEAGTPQSTSVRAYADILLEDASTGRVDKAMIRAMLNFGNYTQIYTGYNTGNLAAAGLYEDGEDPVQAGGIPDLSYDAYTYQLNDKEDGLKVRQASLLLGTDISIRFYYEPGAGKSSEDYDLSLTDSSRVLSLGFDEGRSMYYAEIEHLTPVELGYMYTLQVFNASSPEGNGPLAELNFGALSYCHGVLANDDSSEALRNLCLAIFYYINAAGAYSLPPI